MAMGDHIPPRIATNIQDGLSNRGGAMNCPVQGCWGRAATRIALWVNLIRQNLSYTMIIL